MALSLLCILSTLLSAYECEAAFGACREVKLSDLVFIGTAVSIEPIFLNRWNSTNQSAMRSLNQAYTEAQDHPSADSLRQLKRKISRDVSK